VNGSPTAARTRAIQKTTNAATPRAVACSPPS
jgi:hypothetical protein